MSSPRHTPCRRSPCLSPLITPQLIHGDLHYDNVLVENGKVTGLLDFEFCASDWRAMELAVCLSKVRAPLLLVHALQPSPSDQRPYLIRTIT